MHIRIATDPDSDIWNSYVDAHPEVPPFASYEWRAILARAYGAPTYFFIAEEVDAVRGVCATYVTKPWGGKSLLYSMRFGSLADDEVTGEALLSYIQKFCKNQGIGSFIVTSGYKRAISGDGHLSFVTPAKIGIQRTLRDGLDSRFRGNDRSSLLIQNTKKTVVLDLLDNEEATWNSLRNKTRNMIRKAQKSGLTVELGFQNLRAFYDIYARRMSEKGLPIHSLIFFKQIVKALPNCAELFAAKYEGAIVGGLLLLAGKRTAIYPYQASTEAGEKHAANQLLIWETVRFCIAQGIKKLDMGESKEGGGVYQSKINFGGTPRAVYYYSLGKASHSKFYGLPMFVFDHSPSWMRRKIGPWVKKQSRVI